MPLYGHLMSASGLTNSLGAIRESGFDINPRYFFRFLKMAVLGMPLSPVGVAEQLIFRDKVEGTKLAGPPLMILGHWRTGSTHLHNVLSRDSQFGFLSTYGAYATNQALLGSDALKRLLGQTLPPTRPMDGMALDMDLPQEEEFAMSNLTSLSYYKLFCFPRLSEYYARRHIFFEDVSPEEIEAWKQAYDFLLRKATLMTGHRPLLLKNPPNTARLRHLLALYPDARIIYLYRDPLAVYKSTVRMRQCLFAELGFHTATLEQVTEHVLSTYPKLLNAFFETRHLIQPGNLVAVSYEQFAARPLETLEDIYARLGLPGFDRARPAFERYLGEVEDHKPARYDVDQSLRDLVEKRWGETHARHMELAPL